jgi:hypothetical protein
LAARRTERERGMSAEPMDTHRYTFTVLVTDLDTGRIGFASKSYEEHGKVEVAGHADLLGTMDRAYEDLHKQDEQAA